MSANGVNDLDLHDLFTKLNDSLVLPAEEADSLATQLLNAPEDQFVTRKMRLQAILLHQNISRGIFDRLLAEFSPETLTTEHSNTLHLLITNENTTVEDLQTLSNFAEQSGATEWFDSTVAHTIDISDYQLNLTYNGAQLFADEKVRQNLTRTLELLKQFRQIQLKLESKDVEAS